MEANEIVKALRCRAGDDSGCSGKCPYLLTEPISEDLAELLGIKPGEVQRSCDADQIALDAADLIEKQDIQIRALRGLVTCLKAALSAMKQDLQCAVSGQDGCQFCAHFCNDGKPVYRPDEGCLAYCKKCGMDCRCFEWRGILETEELK